MSDEPAADGVKIPFGLFVETGRMVGVRQVKRGHDCGCICPQCERPLSARQGPINVAHFAHQASEHNCVGAPETAQHRMAKQIVLNAGQIWVPALYAKFPNGLPARTPAEPGRTVRLTDLGKEHQGRRHDMVPDVFGTMDDGSLLWIEIRVAHAVDAAKHQRLAEQQIQSIEIVLADLARTGDEKALAIAVLRTADRHWLWHPRQAAIDQALADALAARQRAEADRQRAKTARLEREAALRDRQDAEACLDVLAAQRRLMAERRHNAVLAEAGRAENEASRTASAAAARAAREAEAEQRRALEEERRAREAAARERWRREDMARAAAREAARAAAEAERAASISAPYGRSCVVCGSLRAWFGFGPPLTRTEVWACREHRQDVDDHLVATQEGRLEL
jgi:Competence protein CoiA-like family